MGWKRGWEKVLSEMGLRVVRFRNEEVVKNLSAVVGNVRELVAGLINAVWVGDKIIQ
jgi:very-short-patch-repair endonuclease